MFILAHRLRRWPNIKVNVWVCSLTLQFYPLVTTEPVHSCVISTRGAHNQKPTRRIGIFVYIAIPVLPGTHLHLSQVKHVRAKCLDQVHRHRNNVPTLRGEKHDMFIKTCLKWGLNPQRQLRSATPQMLTQHWENVSCVCWGEPVSRANAIHRPNVCPTMAQHCTNIGEMYRVCSGDQGGIIQT